MYKSNFIYCPKETCQSEVVIHGENEATVSDIALQYYHPGGSSVRDFQEMNNIDVEIRSTADMEKQNRTVIQMLPAKQPTMLHTSEVNPSSFQPLLWDKEMFSDSINEPDTCSKISGESQIPLTVQFCAESNIAAQPAVSSDDDSEVPSPVFDHEPDPDDVNLLENSDDTTNRCYMCFKGFRQKKNMYAHIRKVHSCQPKIEGGIICPMCEMHSLRHEHLRHHLQSLHSIKINKEEKFFISLEEFQNWKAAVEKETYSYFVSKGASKLLAGIQTRSYFKCHRSGVGSINAIPRQRRQKKQGSYKIGVTCPAAMEVTEDVNGILVIFWSTHIGHSIVSNGSDGSRIRGLLRSGMSWENVLDLLQQESEENSKQSAPKKGPRTSDVQQTNKKTLDKNSRSRKGRMKSVSQATLIEKTENLLNFLETAEVTASFRPLISNMIDNITSIVQRRSNSVMEKKSACHSSTYSDTGVQTTIDGNPRHRILKLPKR